MIAHFAYTTRGLSAIHTTFIETNGRGDFIRWYHRDRETPIRLNKFG